MAPVWHKLTQIVLLVIMFRFLWKVVQASLRAASVNAESDPRIEKGNAVLRLVSSNSPGTAAENIYQLSGDIVTIGRGLDNDVVINDPFISFEHARLVWRRNRYYLEDVHSTNHTYVNGKMVHSSCPLREGDMIALGETLLRFSYQASGKSAGVGVTEG